MKDFKDTYEQKSWESALQLHTHYSRSIARCSRVYKLSHNKEWWQERIDYYKEQRENLEKDFPALKGITYPET